VQIEDFLQDPAAIWAIVATLLVLVEVAIVGIGVGLLFLGLGAYLTAIALYFDWISATNYIAQISTFFFGAAIFAVILWKPLKALRKNKTSYNDMIGQLATVVDTALTKEKRGKVKWSGVIMKAKLSVDADIDQIEIGQDVMIKEVIGTTLIVDTAS